MDTSEDKALKLAHMGGVGRDEEPFAWGRQAPSDAEADELMRQMRLSRDGVRSAVLDAPAAKIQHALRRDRRKVALQLYHEITLRLTEQVRELEKIHDAALGEIARRMGDKATLEAMDTEQVMGLLRLSAGALAPYVKRLALPPEKPEVDPRTAAAAGVGELLSQILQAKNEARLARAVEVEAQPVPPSE